MFLRRHFRPGAKYRQSAYDHAILGDKPVLDDAEPAAEPEAATGTSILLNVNFDGGVLQVDTDAIADLSGGSSGIALPAPKPAANRVSERTRRTAIPWR